jgi:hypothetical protein
MLSSWQLLVTQDEGLTWTVAAKRSAAMESSGGGVRWLVDIHPSSDVLLAVTDGYGVYRYER